MNEFFKWLTSNSYATIAVIALSSIGVLSVILVYVIAFFQGRAISFWPPKIGERPARTVKPSKDQKHVSTPHNASMMTKLDIKQIDVSKEFSKELIRVSISALFRIKVDDKYFLVRGNRIKTQNQPVGGVLKYFPDSAYVLAEYGALDDNMMPIDDKSRHDLRIRVPGEKLLQFLEWYRSGKGREVSPWREFYEELVKPEILSCENFPYVYYEHIKTHTTGIKFTKYFDCYEVLIAEIYRLIPTDDQLNEIKTLLNKTNDDYVWADESLIKAQGFIPKVQLERTISETSSWIL